MKKIQLIRLLDIDEESYLTYVKELNFLNKEFKSKYFPFIEEKNILPISFYSYYPVVFRDFFDFNQEQLLNLLKTSHFHFVSLFVLDKLYDSSTNEKKLDFLVMLEMHSYSKNNISKYIKENKCKVDNLYIENMKSLYDEKYNYNINNKLNMKEIENYCFEKYSYAKIIILLFSEIKKIDESILMLLLNTHDKFAVGRQIIDDLTDYQIDYEENTFNIYLNQLENNKISNNSLENDSLKLYLINYAIQQFEDIKELIIEHTNTCWYRYVDMYTNQAINLKKYYESEKML